MRDNIAKKLVAALGIAFGLYLVIVILQPIIFVDRFGAATTIAGIDVSNKTVTAAKSALDKGFAGYQKSSITIGGVSANVSDYVTSIDTEETIKEAMLAEQSGYLSLSKFTRQRHEAHSVLNNDNISKLLSASYYKSAVVPVDANIVLGNEAKVIGETSGKRLMLAESRHNIVEGLGNLSSTIFFYITTQEPMLTAPEAALAVNQAKVVVSAPLTLLGDGVSYTITPADLHSWLKITPTSPKTLVAIENFVPKGSEYNYLDPNKVFLYVDELAKKIDKAPLNAKLAATVGKVVVADPDQLGRTVDRKDAINEIQAAVVGDKTAKLNIATVQPAIRADNLVELGLNELVSTGWTDFSGSSAKRIQNVQVGASKFNGVLIKPDEDFSFNKTLGAVDASTGYVEELVILADKTVPEYGGGLCQVSSTAFRAALNAGIPITERYPHAYPVSYYKPFGVDATIYLPNPDLRFKNDTGKYILIQTRIIGKLLYFDFYGTKKPVTIKFSGNAEATGAVPVVESMTPTLSDFGARGKNSFTAVFYRHIYDVAGKLIANNVFTSKYDSPDKYPH